VALIDGSAVDLRTAALQFSAAPDIAAALVVGAGSDHDAWKYVGGVNVVKVHSPALPYKVI
jgi:hypothetical protein